MEQDSHAEIEQGQQVVAVGHGVHAVAAHLAEMQGMRRLLAIDVVGHPRQRAAPERADVGQGEDLVAAVEIAAEHLLNRHQVVTQGDRLSRLEMRESGRDRIRLGAIDERGHEVHQRAPDPQRQALDVEAHIGGDLVVAAAGGVKAAAGIPEPLDKDALHVAVNVLIAGVGGSAGLVELPEKPVEFPGQRVGVGRTDDSLGTEHGGVRPAGDDVLAIEPPVPGKRAGERSRRVGGLRLEAPAPHAGDLSPRAGAGGARG